MFAHTAHRTAIILTLLVCCETTATAQQRERRTWTDSTGKFSVEAEFVAISDGKLVLKKAGGKEISVPFEKCKRPMPEVEIDPPDE